MEANEAVFDAPFPLLGLKAEPTLDLFWAPDQASIAYLVAFRQFLNERIDTRRLCNYVATDS